MKQLIKKFEITVIIENLYKRPEKEFVLSEPVTLNEPVTVQKKKKTNSHSCVIFKDSLKIFKTLSQNARKFMKAATVKCSLPKIAWPEFYSKKILIIL